MELIDTHVHLMMPEYEKTLPEVLSRAKERSVTTFICPGIDLPTSKQAIDLHNKYPEIIPAVGLHPMAQNEDLGQFADLAQNPVVKAIGEIGTDIRAGDFAEQEKRFRFFLELAIKTNKPALVHTIRTWEPTMKILADYPELKGKVVMHCFNAGEEEANQAKALGVLLSFTAIIARKGMSDTHNVIKSWTLEQMMLESDAPWLAWPGDGEVNEPKVVALICKFIAEIKGIAVEEVAQKTTNTAQTFFAI